MRCGKVVWRPDVRWADRDPEVKSGGRLHAKIFLFVTAFAIGWAAIFDMTVAALVMKSTFKSRDQAINPVATVAAGLIHAGMVTIGAFADRRLVLTVVEKHGLFLDIRHFDDFRHINREGGR